MEKKAVSIRQLAIICFIATFAQKITLLPSLMFKDVGINSLFVIILYAFVDLFLFIIIFALLKKNKDISLYEFLNKLVGKFFCKVIFFMIFALFFCKMLLLMSGGYLYAREVIFQEAPYMLYLFILLVSSAGMYLFGLKSFARTIEFFYPFILFLFIVFLTIPFLTVKMHDLRPLFDLSTSKFFGTFLQYLSLFGDYIFLLLFMGKVKFNSKKPDNKKSDFKYALIRVILSFVILILFYFIFNSMFKYTGYLHSNAITELLQFIPVPSLLGNLDWVTVSFMMLIFLLHGAIFTFAMGYSLTGVVKYKKYNEEKNNKWILVVSYVLLLIFTYLVFVPFETLVAFTKNYLGYFAIIVFMVPVIILILDLCKNRKEKKI